VEIRRILKEIGTRESERVEPIRLHHRPHVAQPLGKALPLRNAISLSLALQRQIGRHGERGEDEAERDIGFAVPAPPHSRC